MEDNFDKGAVIEEDQTNDPRIKFIQMCIKNRVNILPIFDKVLKKTLCLQNYLLQDGHVEGLAEACEFLDRRLINRMLFNNCGMTGDQLATILQGVARMPDFKSLIYKNGGMNSLAIQKLEPILLRAAPNHLEELSIIDIKLSPTLIEELVVMLENKSRVKKLALVNMSHSEHSFLMLTDFFKTNQNLKEVDISWSNVTPQLMLKFLLEVS